MEWAQILSVIGVNFVMFLWLRSESNADRREMLTIIKLIQSEMKDFHARLCVIEEHRKVR